MKKQSNLKNQSLLGLTFYQKSRIKVLEKLGGKCVRCGFRDIRALQIDHVNGGGVKEHRTILCTAFHRKVMADTAGLYQLLCANCNWIKRSERGEVSRPGLKPKRERVAMPTEVRDYMAISLWSVTGSTIASPSQCETLTELPTSGQ